MDRTLVKALRDDMNEALKAVAKKHGMDVLSVGNATFSPSGSVSFKVEGVQKGGSSPEAELYAMYRRSHYDIPELNGVIKDYKGTEYKVIGLRNRSLKVIAHNLTNGKDYLIPMDMVKMYFQNSLTKGKTA